MHIDYDFPKYKYDFGIVTIYVNGGGGWEQYCIF